MVISSLTFGDSTLRTTAIDPVDPNDELFSEFNRTMSDWLATFNRTGIYNLEWISVYMEDVNMDCVTRELKVSENGDKVLNLPKMVILGLISLIRCQNNENIMETIKSTLRTVINSYKTPRFNVTKDCYIGELKKIDPNSLLVENFDEQVMINTEMKCDKEIDDKGFEQIISNSEIYIGSLASFTCGTLQQSDIKKLGMTAIVLAFEKSKELEDSEVGKLGIFLKEKIDKLFECFMKNM